MIYWICLKLLIIFSSFFFLFFFLISIDFTLSSCVNTSLKSLGTKLLALLCTSTLPRHSLFLFRYVFQASLYHIWQESNVRRHGDLQSPHRKPDSSSSLIKTCETESVRSETRGTIATMNVYNYGSPLDHNHDHTQFRLIFKVSSLIVLYFFYLFKVSKQTDAFIVTRCFGCINFTFN